jgi:hypothetical protein
MLREQYFCEGAATGTDFNQAVLGLRMDRGGDPFEDRRVMQEVLTETFPAWRRFHAVRVMI